MQIITVANQKGGAGKTSFTVLLSIALAISGKRILIIDTDPQGGSTAFLSGKEKPNITTYDLIMGETPEIKQIERNGVFIDFIGADYRLDMIYATIDHLSVKRALNLIPDNYDFVIFDTPPTLQGITRACAVVSNLIIIPADISESTISPTLYTINKLHEMEKTGKVLLIGKDPKDKTGYVADLTRDFVKQLSGNFSGYVDKSATMQKIIAGVSNMSKAQSEKILKAVDL